MSAHNAKSQSPNLSDTRKFGYVLAGSALVAGSIWTGLIYLLRREWKLEILFYFLAIGGNLCLLCLVLPGQLQPFHRGWLHVTKFLERAITFILLATFFYFILTPVALCLRLFGHEPFIKRGDKSTSSYWEPVKTAPKVERYYRQY